ncbi:MAG TPA: glycosyltransferase [Solirubrobacteraceae bacterium]|nr:glycosyltransferase [Solirubrobacteraceae bacterium]
MDVDLVIPVLDEEAQLADSVRRVRAFCARELPYSWRIVIADNASTDRTAEIGRALAARWPEVAYLRLERRGRGRALRAAWSASDSRVVCYMDVDLSTDLRALPPLVAPLLSGHSDVAIGSRLHRDSHVVRGPRRELISRAYNALLRLALRARFSDAQCGFKAVRGDVARELLADVRDDGWFFDTELLVRAQRRGLRIHEVPVDWVDDADSRVRIVPTALDDLRGVARLLADWPVARFAAVGVASTAAYAVLYLLLRGPLGAGGANVASLALTAVGNTAANRRLTFGVRGRAELARHHLLGGVVFLLTLGLTTGALAALHGVAPSASRMLELSVLVVATAAATVTRWVALRTWVFARRSPAPSSRSAHDVV